MRVMIYFIMLLMFLVTLNSCQQLQTLNGIRYEIEYLRADLRKVNKR